MFYSAIGCVNTPEHFFRLIVPLKSARSLQNLQLVSAYYATRVRKVNAYADTWCQHSQRLHKPTHGIRVIND